MALKLASLSTKIENRRLRYIRCESRFSHESGAAKGCVVEATFPCTELFIWYYAYTSVTGWGPCN
eukprot:scaffold8280_cov68-Attheya_sp.AAC.1